MESSDTEIEQGTGLGLAIVARIVRNMNGQLRAESEVGRGSKFTFAFNFPLPTPAQVAAFLEAAKATPQLESTSVTYPAPLGPGRERPVAVRKHSNDSIQSRGSTGSARSEIDQLVEMIASPSLEDPPRSVGARHMKRRNSPGTERKMSDRGEYNVQDSGTPIRSVKVDEEDVDVPAAGQSPIAVRSPKLSPKPESKPEHLHVLVAEDDPVNRAIVKKRLEMDGHHVILTQNGSEAVDAFADMWKQCDIILMDLQVSYVTAIANREMPVMDGLTATRQIRENEQQRSPSACPPSSHLYNNNRIPIFAVSASLPESRAKEISDAQFDGWILKPINFRRVREIIGGLWDSQKRRNDLYTPGTSKINWERGGWLAAPAR